MNKNRRMSNGMHLPFPKKYRGIIITSITAKIYNALLRNRIEPKIEKYLGKTKMDITNFDYPSYSRRCPYNKP